MDIAFFFLDDNLRPAARKPAKVSGALTRQSAAQLPATTTFRIGLDLLGWVPLVIDDTAHLRQIKL
jgi:hypothetical protein